MTVSSMYSDALHSHQIPIHWNMFGISQNGIFGSSSPEGKKRFGDSVINELVGECSFMTKYHAFMLHSLYNSILSLDLEQPHYIKSSL